MASDAPGRNELFERDCFPPKSTSHKEAVSTSSLTTGSELSREVEALSRRDRALQKRSQEAPRETHSLSREGSGRARTHSNRINGERATEDGMRGKEGRRKR